MILPRMVRRSDVNYIFYKNNGAAVTGSNDSMFFYSEAPGYLSSSATSAMATTGSAGTVALVGYRINQFNPYYSGVPVMERLGEDLTWGGARIPRGHSPAASYFLPIPFPPFRRWRAIGLIRSGCRLTMPMCPVIRKTQIITRCSATWFSAWNSASCSRAALMSCPGPAWSLVPLVTRTRRPPYPRLSLSRILRPITLPPIPCRTRQAICVALPPDLGGIVVTIAVLDDTSLEIVPGDAGKPGGSGVARRHDPGGLPGGQR